MTHMSNYVLPVGKIEIKFFYLLKKRKVYFIAKNIHYCGRKMGEK